MLFAALVALFLSAGPLPNEQRPAVQAASRANTISIDNFSFNAPTLTVSAGSQVTWINHDDVPHKVVSTDKKFASPVLDTDGRFTHTFTTPGTYEYFCSIHPTMKGKVVVK